MAVDYGTYNAGLQRRSWHPLFSPLALAQALALSDILSCRCDPQAFDGKRGHAYAKLLPEGVGNGELMAEGEGALSLGAGDKRWDLLRRLRRIGCSTAVLRAGGTRGFVYPTRFPASGDANSSANRTRCSRAGISKCTMLLEVMGRRDRVGFLCETTIANVILGDSALLLDKIWTVATGGPQGRRHLA